MTIDEAIKHAEEVMIENLEKTKDRNASDPIAINCFECADEHRQLAEWLKDYKRLLEKEPCNDLISREETLTAFADYIGSGMSMNDYDALWDIVEKMPPARPQKPASKKSLQAHSVECNKYL